MLMINLSYNFCLMKVIFYIFNLLIVIAAHAQDAPVYYFNDSLRIQKLKKTQQVVDKIYKDYAREKNFPGFTYAIIADGSLLYSGNVGYTDVNKKIPVNNSSAFRIASMTKSFTTLAILKLRDDGKLKLDDPASLYIPEMKNIKYLTEDAPVITIRDLMTHSAGFPEDNPWGDRQLAVSDDELLKVVKQVSFSNVPGISYEYSNLGFSLLGYIIKQVSGKPYDVYINENILKPLGMHNTYWEYTHVLPDKLAHGYRWINNEWKEEELLHHGAYGAMGGLITTIEDFSKYAALHLSAWPTSNQKESPVLKRSSLREMHQPWRFSSMNLNFKYPNGRTCPLAIAYGYGLGWSKDCDGRIRVGHSGGLPGFGSYWGMLPEYGIAVVSFANLTYGPNTFINLKVLDTLISLADLKPRQLAPSDILVKRKNELVKLIPNFKGAKESGIFAVNFFDDYIIDTLRKDAEMLYKKAGAVLKVREIIPENQLRGSFVLEGKTTDIEIYFTLSPENPPLIQEYRIREKSKK
jgi:CubicO group peptidase (beta-lactamase class C family)